MLNAILPRDLMPDAAVAAEAHRNLDAMIEDALDQLAPDFKMSRHAIQRSCIKIGLLAAHDAGGRLSMRDSTQIAAAFTVRGYVKRRSQKGWGQLGGYGNMN